MFERPKSGEVAILAHVDQGLLPVDEAFEEFSELARSAGAKPAEFVLAKRKQIDPKYCIGAGKADEIKFLIQQHQAQLVLINFTLSPSQQRNLEALWQCRVVDRIGLILDIFAQRARTHEGKLQVELAQLNYMSTRLVRGWTHLERQKGGIGLRGPGETQLETDRRLIRGKIDKIKERLGKVRKQRAQTARARQRSGIPIVTLVGYTNAGKSTLFNTLSGSDVYAANQLFATLDPTMRKIWLGSEPPMANAGVDEVQYRDNHIILADTVGFIRDIPHELVDAFRATLEETANADLLLHIIDVSNPAYRDQIDEVYNVLADIGADNIPVIEVYNKIDRIEDIVPHIEKAPLEQRIRARVFCSAVNKRGLSELKQLITETVFFEK